MNETSLVQLFLGHEGQINVITRASEGEVDMAVTVSTGEWISFQSETPDGRPVGFKILRSKVIGYMFGPIPDQPKQSALALPMGVRRH